MKPVHNTKKVNYIGFDVRMASSNSVTYFEKGELIIEYNTKAFGDSIVSKGTLVYDIPRNYQRGRNSRINSIPEHFEVSLKDIAHNQFIITWKNTGSIDQSLQLLPNDEGVHAATLYFLPINQEEPIKLKPIGIDSLNLQYNFESGKLSHLNIQRQNHFDILKPRI